MTTISIYNKNQIDNKMPKTISLTAGTTGYEWTPSDFNGAICHIVIDTSNVLTDVDKVTISGYITAPNTDEYVGSINVLDNSVAKILRIRNVNNSNNKITLVLDVDGTDIAPANYTLNLIYQNMYQ